MISHLPTIWTIADLIVVVWVNEVGHLSVKLIVFAKHPSERKLLIRLAKFVTGKETELTRYSMIAFVVRNALL